MAGLKKKQHFVPQCYLNAFADANCQLYVFDKFKCKSFKANVKGLAQKHRFYDLLQDYDEDTDAATDADVKFYLKFKESIPNPQIVEDMFSELEKDYAAVFRNVQQTIKERKPLSINQKYILAHFITVQYRRTPEHRKLLMEQYEKISAKVWEITHEGQKISFKYNGDISPWLKP